MSKVARALIALFLGAVVALVAGAFAFLGPALVDPSAFLAWGWVAFFVGPAVAAVAWALATAAFNSMMARGRSVAPWVITGLSLLPAIAVWQGKHEWLTGVATRQWTEDVLLEDGSVVSVERHTRTEQSQKLDASMKFAGELAQLPEWRGSFAPLVLYEDQSAREWVVVATTGRCEVLYQRGPPRYWFAADRPVTIYFEFRTRNGAWVQTPLSAASIGQRANLVVSFEELERSHLTVSAKEQLRQRSDADYRSVLERPEYKCGRTTNTQAIWDAEDRVLAALDRENATAEQRARVGELLAGTSRPSKAAFAASLTAAGLAQFAP
jgi:hypothetical protein